MRGVSYAGTLAQKTLAVLQLPSRKRIPQGPCLPRLPVRNNLRPRPSLSRRKRRRSRSRLPTRDLSTLNCRIHTTP